MLRRIGGLLVRNEIALENNAIFLSRIHPNHQLPQPAVSYTHNPMRQPTVSIPRKIYLAQRPKRSCGDLNAWAGYTCLLVYIPHIFVSPLHRHSAAILPIVSRFRLPQPPFDQARIPRAAIITKCARSSPPCARVCLYVCASASAEPFLFLSLFESV